MTIYQGQLNVLTDSQGSIVPIVLAPSDIPTDGLTIDASRLNTSSPAGQTSFGNILGVTIDATNSNLAQAAGSVIFPEISITRSWNGGVSQIFQIPPGAQRVTITNKAGAFNTGTIFVSLWNSKPTTEISSPVSVTASGSVTISGTPTVQFAAGQSVNIGTLSAGNVSVVNTPTVVPPGLQTAELTLTLNAAGNFGSTIEPAATHITLRGWEMFMYNSQCYAGEMLVHCGITDATQAVGTLFPVLNLVVPIQPIFYQELSVETGVSITGTNGLGFGATVLTNGFLNPVINATLGLNVSYTKP